MKFFILLFILVLCPLVKTNAQIKILSDGKVGIGNYPSIPSTLTINGNSGSFTTAPRIMVNSAYTGISYTNSAFNVFNFNTTAGNFVRLNFATNRSDGVEEDFVGLATCFKDRTVSTRSADFHIATLAKASYAVRFSILSSTLYGNRVSFKFNVDASQNSSSMLIDDQGYYGQLAIRPNVSGNGCIGSSNYIWSRLYVGTTYCDNYAQLTSDSRYKENIKDISEGSLSKLMKLRPVTYKFKKDISTIKYSIDENLVDKNRMVINPIIPQKSNDKEQYGLLAQEVKEVFPEIVEYDSIADKYSIAYTALIPIIIKSLKEQNATIEKLENEISD